METHEDLSKKPAITTSEAEELAGQQFGIFGKAHSLPGERDQNFRIECSLESFVLKISHPDIHPEFLEFENQALRLAEAIEEFDSPRIVKSIDNQSIVPFVNSQGQTCRVRCLSFLPGTPLAEFQDQSLELYHEIGRCLGSLDNKLAHLNHNPMAKRKFKWDLAEASNIVESSFNLVTDERSCRLLKTVLERYRLVAERIEKLHKSVIHNDANDYNWIVSWQPSTQTATLGLIDFGDAVYSTSINDLAICCAYAMLGKKRPIDVAASIIAGYHQSREIHDAELSVLFPSIGMRLAQSVSICAEQKKLRPDDPYLAISERPAWELLNKLVDVDVKTVNEKFESAINNGSAVAKATAALTAGEILRLRQRLVAPSLSLSYQDPLHIVQGNGQYLYDQNGAKFLDCVNNVCHIGHCNAHVASAIANQASVLNTNTRYLHPNIVRLAERLIRTLPDPLEVCFFVNSGSEANDLALRLAKNFTQASDIVVVDHAYHGHTSSLIDISPYKFNRPGGNGKPGHVHILEMPDGFRGSYRYEDPEYGQKYVHSACDNIDDLVGKDGRQIAAFIAESLLSCGGQIVLPEGYLAAVHEKIRAVGGVCIADEVQVGFGRVGSAFWGFQLGSTGSQAIVPDIVTMGKPFGNGHPLAAVVTNGKIADAFNNGMEYFNTFGGNPVSCAAGLAVLDEIENQNLQRNALLTGQKLINDLKSLQKRYPDHLGDVRGAGLFVGIEFVESQGSRQPNSRLAVAVVNAMKQRHILLSTDGPDNNVIKIKPPMVFDEANVERLVSTLDSVLDTLVAE